MDNVASSPISMHLALVQQCPYKEGIRNKVQVSMTEFMKMREPKVAKLKGGYSSDIILVFETDTLVTLVFDQVSYRWEILGVFQFTQFQVKFRCSNTGIYQYKILLRFVYIKQVVHVYLMKSTLLVILIESHIHWDPAAGKQQLRLITVLNFIQTFWMISQQYQVNYQNSETFGPPLSDFFANFNVL